MAKLNPKGVPSFTFELVDLKTRPKFVGGMFANGYAILKWAKARQRMASGWSPLLPKSPAIIKPQKITNQEHTRNTNSASKPELEPWVCSIGKRCANKQSRPCFVKGRFFIGGPVQQAIRPLLDKRGHC